MRRAAPVANAANNDASFWHAIANVHAVLAKPCKSKSPMRRPAAVAMAANNDPSFRFSLANAQAVLAISCVLKSPMVITWIVCCNSIASASAFVCSQHCSANGRFASQVKEVQKDDRMPGSKRLLLTW